MKKTRFFYHYRKCDKKMSVHFKNQCFPVENIVCYAACESKWKNKQPFLVMQGFATQVEIVDNVAHIK